MKSHVSEGTECAGVEVKKTRGVRKTKRKLLLFDGHLIDSQDLAHLVT